MSAVSRVRPRVIVIWLLLLALVAGILFVRYKERAFESKPAPPANDRMLLPMSISDLGAIEIFYVGTLHRFERDAAGAWFYHAHGAPKANDTTHAHQTDAAQAETIKSALRGLSRAHMEREFPRENEAEYGLTTPEMIVLIYGKNTAQLLDKFTVGTVAPDGFSRYISTNNYPKIITIANFQIENLQNLLKSVGAISQTSKK